MMGMRPTRLRFDQPTITGYDGDICSLTNEVAGRALFLNLKSLYQPSFGRKSELKKRGCF